MSISMDEPLEEPLVEEPLVEEPLVIKVKKTRLEADAIFTKKKSLIEKFQDDEFIKEKKYKQLKKGAVDGADAVHVYDGPRGKGYALVFEGEDDGVSYTKYTFYGPESSRSTGWTERSTEV